MKEKRPDFRDIKSFEEFNKYYWYHNATTITTHIF